MRVAKRYVMALGVAAVLALAAPLSADPSLADPTMAPPPGAADAPAQPHARQRSYGAPIQSQIVHQRRKPPSKRPIATAAH
jgi:hypothetical protein